MAVGTRSMFSHSLSVLTLLILEVAVITGAYVCFLFFATGQRSFYLEILRGLRPSSIKTKELVSA
jgi:hypothetical protein